MNDELSKKLSQQGAELIRFVDISSFPAEQRLGLSAAILFCMPLDKDKLDDDEFCAKEWAVEDLADWLAEYLQQQGYRAHSQSQKSNLKAGYVEAAYLDRDMKQGVSLLPQKTIARAAGLGFMGKNNLMITEQYGCAFTMCSVLTDAPVQTASNPIIAPQCGSCDECAQTCPAGALHCNDWTEHGGREALVDVSACCICLMCVAACPWTEQYVARTC